MKVKNYKHKAIIAKGLKYTMLLLNSQIEVAKSLGLEVTIVTTNGASRSQLQKYEIGVKEDINY